VNVNRSQTATASARLEQIPAPLVPPDVDTPCPIVDLAVLDRNIAAMQAAMDAAGVRLRPHVKTHKSTEVARRQLAAGAQGITVGTLGEAEVFADAGIDDIFVAYPLWCGGSKAARLRAVHERTQLMVGVDSVPAVEVLAKVFTGAPGAPGVLVEVDCGAHRSGVRPTAVGEIARAADRAGLPVHGAFTHGGHGYASPAARPAAAEDERSAMEIARCTLDAAGMSTDVLSAGSTPTALLAAQPPITEMRPGTYVYNDAMQVALGACEPAEVAFFVAATVVSSAVDGQVILDAGAKATSRDVVTQVQGLGWLPGYPKAEITALHDYHAFVSIPDGSAAPALGEVVSLVPTHVCPAVNLYDELTVCVDGRVVDQWKVDARGRSG
jgi:D-serine deaminase-like pyridoxal phosphate-dependent protein